MVYIELVSDTKDQKGNNHIIFFSIDGDVEAAKKELFDNEAKWIEIPSINGVLQGIRKDQIVKYIIYPESVVAEQQEKIQ